MSAEWLPASLRLRLSGRSRAVAGYAGAGWPVVAGAWWAGDRFRCGPMCGVGSLHPVCDDIRGPREVPAVPGGGAGHRGSLLLVTGAGVDVLELPALAAQAAVEASRLGAPVARMPVGRWLVFAGSGPVDPGLWSPGVGRAGLLLHGADSFVPLPPSQVRHGPVRWRRRPRLAVEGLVPVAELLERMPRLLPAPVPTPAARTGARR